MKQRASAGGIVWAAVAIAAAALGATASGARRPAQGGTFRLPTDSPIHSLDPLSVRWPAEATLALALYDSPYRLHPDGHSRPHLLYPVQTLGGGRTLRLKVRPHAVFHDGSPVRASHVVNSLQRVAKSSRSSWLLAMIEGVPAGSHGSGGISLVGTNTVQIRLRSGRALELLVHALATPQTSVIPSGRRAGKGIGTGPFALRARRGGDRILRANRDYFDGPPYLSEIRLLGPTSRDDHIRRFQLGKADGSLLGDSVYGETPPIKGITLVNGPPTRLVYLLFNTSKGPTGSLPLRRAIDLALDRRRMAGSTAQPLGWPGGRNPTQPEPSRARSLVGGLGITSASRPLVFLIDEADTFGVALAPLLQRDLAAVGLPVDRVVASAGEARGRLKAGTWDLRIQTVSPLSTNDVLVMGQLLALGGLEREAVRLVQGAPLSEREGLLRASTVLSTQLPVIPLVSRRPRLHHRTYLRGVAYDQLGRLTLADIWRPRSTSSRSGR